MYQGPVKAFRPRRPDLLRQSLRHAYADESPVGFVMISDEVGSPEYIPHFSGSCSLTSATSDEA